MPRERARDAVRGVRDVIDRAGLQVSFPIEVRFVAPDDIPLSTAYGRDTCYVAVHMARGVDYDEYFHGVEALMNSLDGRPHWGKLHFQNAATLEPALPGVGSLPDRPRQARPRGSLLERRTSTGCSAPRQRLDALPAPPALRRRDGGAGSPAPLVVLLPPHRSPGCPW